MKDSKPDLHEQSDESMRIVISAPDKVCTSCNTVRSVAFARDNRRISVANPVGEPLLHFSRCRWSERTSPSCWSSTRTSRTRRTRGGGRRIASRRKSSVSPSPLHHIRADPSALLAVPIAHAPETKSKHRSKSNVQRLLLAL